MTSVELTRGINRITESLRLSRGLTVTRKLNGNSFPPCETNSLWLMRKSCTSISDKMNPVSRGVLRTSVFDTIDMRFKRNQ